MADKNSFFYTDPDSYAGRIDKGIIDGYNWLVDKADNVTDWFSEVAESGIKIPEKGILDTKPGEPYWTMENWGMGDGSSGDSSLMTLAPAGVYESDYFTSSPSNHSYDSIYGTPEEVQGFNSDRPYVSTPMGGTAVTERPWSDDEINVNAFGSYTGGQTGIDTADDRFKNYAAENLLRDTGNNYTTDRNPNNYEPRPGGAGTYSAAAQSPEFILSQDLSQRTPSGTQYPPDLSAYMIHLCLIMQDRVA